MKYKAISISCFFVAVLMFGIAIWRAESKAHDVVKVEYGRAAKVEFDGHSYVVWQQNWSDCILHDPDCKCHRIENARN